MRSSAIEWTPSFRGEAAGPRAGIHNHRQCVHARLVLMVSGFAALRRPGMTCFAESIYKDAEQGNLETTEMNRGQGMARVSLIQEQEHPEFAELVDKFRAGRRGRMINIYRMLLNSPPLAESWFNHSNAVRWRTTLEGRLREIVIIPMGPPRP